MRVGVLTTSYPRSADDPAGHFVAGFAEWLRAHVGDVEVIAASERWPIFYRGGAPDALSQKRAWPLAAAFSARLAAKAVERAQHWDAIVSHWVAPCGVIGHAIARGRRHLAIAHGSDARLMAKIPGGKNLLRKISAHGDLVFVSDAIRLPGVAGRVQPMGIDAMDLAVSNRLSDKPLQVLFLGRLVSDKGADLAIDALPEDCELTVAGDGPWRRELEKRALGKRVRFIGEVRGVAKSVAMSDADVLVVPSRQDASPTVISEAQAAGVPVIATRVGGIVERAGDAAFFCHPNRVSLGAAITRLRDDSALRRTLIERGKVRDFSWKTVGPKLWTGEQNLTHCARLDVLRV